MQERLRGPARPGARLPDPRWVAGEAREEGVEVSAAQYEAAFQEAWKATFPKQSDFDEFLVHSGMTLADVRFQVAFNTLYAKLRDHAAAQAERVTDRDVLTFYKRHRSTFREPQRRDLRVVLTKTRARARAVLDALLRGPVKTRFGYSVFEVVKIRPARQLELRQASRAIRNELEARNRGAAVDSLDRRMRNTWKLRTTCAFVVTECANAPAAR